MASDTEVAMTSPSKRKGNTFEREIVNQARALGLDAERAYGSNGEALGECAQVDCLVQGMRIQAKRRKAIASYLLPEDGVDAVVFRADRGEPMVLMRWHDVMDKLRDGDW